MVRSEKTFLRKIKGWILLDSESDARSSTVNEPSRFANEMQAFVSVLIGQADDEDKITAHVATPAASQAAATSATTVGRAAFAEEFKELADLKAQGVLSEQEFSEMKASIVTGCGLACNSIALLESRNVGSLFTCVGRSAEVGRADTNGRSFGAGRRRRVSALN